MKYVLILTYCLLALSVQARRQEQLDSLFRSLANAGYFNGNVLLAEKGQVIYCASFGIAEKNAGRQLDRSSVFELASCSKQFTAAAILLLQQQGKLQLDDPLEKWIPAMKIYPGIRISHLVYHSSGLPDYMDLMETHWDHSKIATNKDMIAQLQAYHPEADFPPGTKFAYSNTGYALLASVIESASGMSYASYLQHYIFRPLEMKHSFVYSRRLQPAIVPDYAFGYVHAGDHDLSLPDSIPGMASVRYLDGIQGDGTVNSTVDDLLRWDRALYTDRLFNAAARRQLFTAGRLDDSSSTGYGFGWMLKTDSIMGRVAAHSGGWFGYVTYIERHLDKDKTIIILQNRHKAELPVKAVRALLYGQPLPVKPVRQEIAVAADVLEAYVGVYALSPDFQITIMMDNGQLLTQATGQSSFPIYASSDTRFFLKMVDAELEFDRDTSGIVKGLTLHQGGKAQYAARVP